MSVRHLNFCGLRLSHISLSLLAAKLMQMASGATVPQSCWPDLERGNWELVPERVKAAGNSGW